MKISFLNHGNSVMPIQFHCSETSLCYLTENQNAIPKPKNVSESEYNVDILHVNYFSIRLA